VTAWAEEMGAAYCAGLDGLPCPNDFRACWEQGVAHRQGWRWEPDNHLRREWNAQRRQVAS
jgi:hypothetical protein